MNKNKNLKEKKMYVAGPITGIENFWVNFQEAEDLLKKKYNAKIMNPAKLGAGFSQDEYMRICYKMISACDIIVFIDGWKRSAGAMLEYKYGKATNKKLYELLDGKIVELKVVSEEADEASKLYKAAEVCRAFDQDEAFERKAASGRYKNEKKESTKRKSTKKK